MTKTANITLRAALEAYKPQLVERFAAMTRQQFDNLVRRFGKTMNENKSIYNSIFVKVWSEQIRPLCTYTTVPGDLRGKLTTYDLDPVRVERAGQKYAEATIIAWEAKIAAKMGELESADCRHLNGVSFVITGKRAGRSVRIEQDMILNTSPKGTLFNQFPARIYVEGKFTSEAAYKKMFA